MNQRMVGSCFEAKAAAYLQAEGLCVLQKNYRCRIGEIDLVAKDGDTLVFVEVKYRSGGLYGSPEEAVNQAKQKKIRRVAQFYLIQQGTPPDTCCRFDVIAIGGDGTIVHFQNAFGGI